MSLHSVPSYIMEIFNNSSHWQYIVLPSCPSISLIIETSKVVRRHTNRLSVVVLVDLKLSLSCIFFTVIISKKSRQYKECRWWVLQNMIYLYFQLFDCHICYFRCEVRLCNNANGTMESENPRNMRVAVWIFFLGGLQLELDQTSIWFPISQNTGGKNCCLKGLRVWRLQI